MFELRLGGCGLLGCCGVGGLHSFGGGSVDDGVAKLVVWSFSVSTGMICGCGALNWCGRKAGSQGLFMVVFGREGK